MTSNASSVKWGENANSCSKLSVRTNGREQAPKISSVTWGWCVTDEAAGEVPAGGREGS